jgi:hypothetical protein
MAVKKAKATKPDSVEEQTSSSHEESAATSLPKEKARRAKKAKPLETAEEPKEVVQAQPQTPWELVSDGTSVIDVQIISDKDQGRMLGDPAEESRRVSQGREELMAIMTLEERLAYGVELTKELQAKINLSWHGMMAIFTRYVIQMGLMLLDLRRLTKELKLPWEKFAATRLEHIPERTRQEYMQIASRPDAHVFAFLGKERLMHLIRATALMKGDDRLGDFLRKHEIPFDPQKTSEKDKLEAFRNSVDAAIAVERAEKAGVSAPLDKVRTLLAMGVKVDNKVIERMSLLQKNAGKPETYLDALIKNQGIEENPFEGEVRIEALGKLVARLKSTAKAIMDKPSLKIAINTDEISDLEDLVKQLKDFVKAP